MFIIGMLLASTWNIYYASHIQIKNYMYVEIKKEINGSLSLIFTFLKPDCQF